MKRKSESACKLHPGYFQNPPNGLKQSGVNNGMERWPGIASGYHTLGLRCLLPQRETSIPFCYMVQPAREIHTKR